MLMQQLLNIENQLKYLNYIFPFKFDELSALIHSLSRVTFTSFFVEGRNHSSTCLLVRVHDSGTVFHSASSFVDIQRLQLFFLQFFVMMRF